MSLESIVSRKLKIKNVRVRQFLAEFHGSFILAYIGIGAAHATSGLLGYSGSSIHGALAGGLGVALGIFFSAGASGGHLNPSVTMAHFILGKMGTGFLSNVIGTVVYLAAQFLGMFVAAAMSYWVYSVTENAAYQSSSSPAKDYAFSCLYSTCPTSAQKNAQFTLLIDQIIGSAILATTVLAVTDKRNNDGGPRGMAPLIIGLSATTVGLSYGVNAGGAINAARDFAPRCFASIIYGKTAFTGYAGNVNSDYFFWVPLLGSFLGGCVAGIIYLFYVLAHWPEDENKQQKERKVTIEDAADL